MRVLIAAGGTAGHINPALAIAGAIKKADPSAEIHFAGRKEGIVICFCHLSFLLCLLRSLFRLKLCNLPIYVSNHLIYIIHIKKITFF